MCECACTYSRIRLRCILIFGSMMAYTVFSIAYGYRPQSDNDELLLMIKKMMEDFSVFATPGNFLVDIFPIRESTYRSPCACS